MGNSQSCQEVTDGPANSSYEEPNPITLVVGCKSKEETEMIVSAIYTGRYDPLKRAKILTQSTVLGQSKQKINIQGISGKYSQMIEDIQVRIRDDILAVFLVLSQTDQITLEEKKEIINQSQKNLRQAEIHLIVNMGENNWTGEEQVRQIKETCTNIVSVIQLKQYEETKEFETIFQKFCRSYSQQCLENSQASTQSSKKKK